MISVLSVGKDSLPYTSPPKVWRPPHRRHLSPWTIRPGRIRRIGGARDDSAQSLEQAAARRLILLSTRWRIGRLRASAKQSLQTLNRVACGATAAENSFTQGSGQYQQLCLVRLGVPKRALD